MTPGHKLLPVKLPVFEGPLDLLLHLIERNELDISGVSLVLVVDQYMQYLSLMRAEMKLEAAADFLVVAGKLLLIKSRSLLPRAEPPLEAEGLEDPAEELARHLEEYRRFKQVADALRDLKASRGQSFGRTGGPPDEIPPKVTLTGLELDGLVESFTQADRIATIEAGLSSARTLAFDRLLEDCRGIEDVIVTFLAVLELLKQARIRVWQLSAFGRIVISR